MSATVLPLSEAYQQKADHDVDDIKQKLARLGRTLKAARIKAEVLRDRCAESERLVDEISEALKQTVDD